MSDTPTEEPTAAEPTDEAPAAEAPAEDAAPPAEPDPLREGQRRCQQMGEAAAGDSECLRIWAETRDRFLGTRTVPRRAHEGR